MSNSDWVPIYHPFEPLLGAQNAAFQPCENRGRINGHLAAPMRMGRRNSCAQGAAAVRCRLRRALCDQFSSSSYPPIGLFENEYSVCDLRSCLFLVPVEKLLRLSRKHAVFRSPVSSPAIRLGAIADG